MLFFFHPDRWRHGVHREDELHPQGPASCEYPGGRQPRVQDCRLRSGQVDRGQWVHSETRWVTVCGTDEWTKNGLNSDLVVVMTPCFVLSCWLKWTAESRCFCFLWLVALGGLLQYRVTPARLGLFSCSSSNEHLQVWRNKSSVCINVSIYVSIYLNVAISLQAREVEMWLWNARQQC